jgi:CRP/FNR family transcriptional regulator, dissimilatory nitrate respiration regulator
MNALSLASIDAPGLHRYPHGTSAGMSIDKIKTQDFLSKLPLFNDVALDELDQIAAATSESYVARGATVFQRGDSCVGFHTVIYGQIKLSFISAQGGEKVVEIIGPGHTFGEALMFMEKPYIVSAQALADSMLLHVSKAAVFDAIERDPKFARKMLAGLSRRIHALVCDVEAYSLRSGSQRVIGYLLKGESHEDGDQVTLPVSKMVIASRLNLTPEHFSRILHDLSQHQLIQVSGRDVTILDIEKLRNYEG